MSTAQERKTFDLGDYVEVKDRIKLFYELFGNGRLVTDEVTMHTAPDGKQRVMVKALAYRSPDDPHPGVGHSWIEIPGATPYTKGSEVENAETSAWGRAIGSLGILIDRSIASQNEIDAKAGEAERPDAGGATEHLLGVESAQGTIRLGAAAAYKLEVRETEEGPAFGFKLEMSGDKSIPQVIVQGPPAAAWIDQVGDPAALKDQHVRVKGRLYSVRAEGRRSFNRLRVTEWSTTFFAYPADASTSASPDGGPPPSEPGSAVSEPSAPDVSSASGSDKAAVNPDTGGSLVSAEPSGHKGSATTPSATEEASASGSAAKAEASPGVDASADPDQCDSASPYGDNGRCELATGHNGPHKILSLAFPESWTER